nr:hypothetical transcript [Hymenolepis microstoma]
MKRKTVFGHYDQNSRGMTPVEVEREVHVLRSIDHHTIVKLYEIYEQDDYSIIILELVTGGELFDRVAEFERLDEHEAVYFIGQILLGVHHMHQLGIVHLDLKPENIMIEDMGTKRIKIIDFGLARKLNPNEVIQDMAGTPEFCAPEIVNFDPITFATDMWAIGVMTYILLSGISPFAGDSQVETFQNILECSVTFDREEFANVSLEAQDFITRLLRKNPRKRDTASDCLRHPWVSPVIRQLTGEPEVIQKINLNGITSPKKTKDKATNGSTNNNNQVRKQSLQDQKKVENNPTPIIQKIDLNGILNAQVHSSSSSSNNSPKLDQFNQKRSSISRPIVTEKDYASEEKISRNEPQIIKKIDLNGVLPSMGTQNSTLNLHPERTKRKSLSSQASTESQTGSESNSISNGIIPKISSDSSKFQKEVVHRHKVVQMNGAFTKQSVSTPKESPRRPSRPEAGLISKLGDLQLSNEPTIRKTSGDSIFGRASKWLEATNNAFDKKFRPISTSSAVTSTSFHRARNAFINKNTIAERKIVFTRVRGDNDQGLPGFKWRVLPSTGAACEQDTNNAT